MKRATVVAVALLLALPVAATAKTHKFTTSLSGTATETYTRTTDQTYQYEANCTGSYGEKRDDKLTADFKTTKPVYPLQLATTAKSLSAAPYEVFSNGSGTATDTVVSTLKPKPNIDASDCPTNATDTQACVLDGSVTGKGKSNFAISSDAKGILSFANDNETDIFKRSDGENSADDPCRAEQDTGLFLGIPVVTKGTVAAVRKLAKHKSVTFKGSYTTSKPMTLSDGTAQLGLQASYKLKFTRVK